MGDEAATWPYLELSRVGRIVDDEVDAEERRAARLDGWMVLETVN
jgi:hypothetical protein